MSVIPPPPRCADDPTRIRVTVADVRAALAGGVYGVCCMCQNPNTRWWDLSACAVEPVIDASGTLTDQVSVHDRCVIAMVSHWWSIVAGPGDDEPQSGRAGASTPDDQTDSVARAHTTATSDRVRRMGGVYAR